MSHTTTTTTTTTPFPSPILGTRRVSTPHGAKGGGIPHGVLPEMGPGGNVGQLTEHRPRWTGTHETVQSPPDTMQKRNKAQADTKARKGAGAAGSPLTEPDPVESKSKGGKRGSVSWAPDLAKDLVSESVSDLVSDSLTDIATAAHLDPVPAEVQDQAVETVTEPEAPQARKSSVDASAIRRTAKPRRESAGEHWSEMDIFVSTPKQTTKKSIVAPFRIYENILP
ncbi:uncharacterized protein [Pempheris klunzingeri]|uniref:uncharacterized protein n=1 Tax=Pempheris klunzingeri TaxID=3127111 RepID=UPI00397F30A5